MNKKEFIDLYTFVMGEMIHYKTHNRFIVPYITDNLLNTVNTIYTAEEDGIDWNDLYINKFEKHYEKILSTTDKDKQEEFIHLLLDCSKGADSARKDDGKYAFEFLTLANAFTSSNKVPTSVKERLFIQSSHLLENLTLYKTAMLKNILKREDISDNFIQYLTYFHTILTANHVAFPPKLQDGAELNEVPQSVIDRLAESFYNSHVGEEFLCSALYWTSEETSKLLLQRIRGNEDAIAAVVSNENINDRMKDFFFRTEGCNPSKLILQHITPYVAQVLYEQATEALFDMELLKETNLNAKYSYQMMINLIESHKLPESSQLDLAYRCVSNGSKRKDSEIATIESIFAKNADYDCVIRELLKIKNKNKEFIYQNKNCPLDIVYDKVYSLIKKADKLMKQNDGKLTSRKICDELHGLASVFQLKKDMYEKIYTIEENSPFPHFERYVMLKNIPTEILKLFSQDNIEIDGKNYEIHQSIKIPANALYYSRKEKMDEDKMKDLYLSILKMTPLSKRYKDKASYDEMKTIMKILEEKDANMIDYIITLKNSFNMKNVEKETTEKFESLQYLMHVLTPANIIKETWVVPTCSREIANILVSAVPNFGDKIRCIVENENEFKKVMELVEASKIDKEEEIPLF